MPATSIITSLFSASPSAYGRGAGGPVERPYYHALCVMAGNFSTILWVKLFDELHRRFGMPATAAHPYPARVAANVMADADQALTGPLSRGDAKTIATNLEVLEGDPFHAVYSAFAKVYDQRS